MYSIFPTKRFQKSLRALVCSGKFERQEAMEVLELLSSDLPLSQQFHDHVLQGDFSGQRECHVRGDILLIYRKDEDVLILIALDIGTHHELFGT